MCAVGAANGESPTPSSSQQNAEVQDAQAQTPTPGQAPAQRRKHLPKRRNGRDRSAARCTATFAFATDYSYRGISQTQRQVAFQPSFTYETPTVSENVALRAYLGAWGSNVYFGNTNPTIAEVDLIAGLRLKALNDKLTGDLSYIRYNYLGAPADLFYDFNESGLVLVYDFGVSPDPGRRALQPQLLRQLRHRLVQVGAGHRANPLHLFQRERRLQDL